MRLLRLSEQGEFSLTKEFVDDPPRYAILSHTWGVDEDEVTFNDLESVSGKSKAGYAKLQFCARQAKNDNLEYFWIDTCCINKANHAELSEAITSMFRWYQGAQHCYVYLSDVSAGSNNNNQAQQDWEIAFRNSRWFTRGWTLQELIAPRSVKFFSQEGELLGDKQMLKQQIKEITGIPLTALSGDPLTQFSIEERFRWATKRNTKRKEDQAYCLLGLFGVFKPLIYGEGHHAFVRLKEEIRKRYENENAMVTMVRPRTTKQKRSLQDEDDIVYDTTKNDPSLDLVESKLDLAKIPYASGAIFNSSDSIHRLCHPATRIDLLNQIQFWIRQADGKSIFWLHGWAGIGKSTISWTFTKWLTDQRTIGDVNLGASFFFKRGEGDRGSSLRFFPTIIRQLVLKIPGLASLVAQVIDSDPFIFDKALAEQFNKLIFQPLQKLDGEGTAGPIIVVVVDALDECEGEGDIKTILQLWSFIPQIKTVCLRLFLTSRPDLPVRLGFQKMSATIHQDMILQDAVPQTTIQQDLSVYLKDTFSEIRNEHNECSVSDTSLSIDWPGAERLQRLVDMALPLFIVAATVCRFVGDLNWDVEERLTEILTYQSIGQLSQMEQTYLPVVKQLASKSSDARDEQKLYQEFRTLVGSIICLAEPLGVKSIAELLGVSPSLILRRLNPLRSVLYVPADHETPIRTLHLSFTEFLLSDRLRNQPFGVDGPSTHLALSKHCLRLLSCSQGLQENMCGLEYPGMLRRQIDPTTIAKRLPPVLQYACRYWVHHVKYSLVEIKDDGDVHIFVKQHFLHWLEALSLMDQAAEAVSLVNVLQSLVAAANAHYLSFFLEDARRIILANLYIINLAPLQLYSSIIVFAPQQSPVRSICGQVPKWLLQYPATPQTWSLELQKLEGHESYVETVVFSPDGSLLASAGGDRTIRLWDPKTGQLRHELSEPSPINALTFSSDSSLLASANGLVVHMWDIKIGRELLILEGHTEKVTKVAFSCNGSLLASSSRDKIVRLWDITTGQEVQLLQLHDSAVTAVAFSPDGFLLASASKYALELWDMRINRRARTIVGYDSNVNDLAFSPNKSLLAAALFDGTVRLWDIETGHEVQRLSAPDQPLEDYGGSEAVAFSPDSSLLALAIGLVVQLWDVENGQMVQRLEGHTYAVMAVSFSPDGLVLASSALHETVRLWSTLVGEETPKLEGHDKKVSAVAFSPDGSLLASASYDRTVRLWDVTTGSEIRIFKGHEDWVLAVTFALEGTVLASAGDDRTIRIWDVMTGRELQIIEEEHPAWVNALVLSPDGSLLASAGDDNTVRLWEVRKDREVHTPLKHGHHVLEHGNGVVTIAFSPDSLILASGTRGATISLWDLSTGEKLQNLQGHTSTISALVFSPDNSLLASASNDGTVRLWEMSRDSGYGRMLKKLDNVPELNRIRFANGNTTLFTNRGAIDIGGDNPDNLHDEDEITLCDDWIEYQNRKLLWLPHEYRGYCSEFCNGKLAIGSPSGRVSIFQLDYDLLATGNVGLMNP